MKIIYKIIAVVLALSTFALLPVTAHGEDSIQAPPSSPEAPVSLSIDNRYIYEGMDKSYSEGYVPRVSDGYATVVVPLICGGELSRNSLCACVDLGDYASMPFVCKNYEKTVELSSDSLYLVSFALELKRDRVNGNYPVSVNVTAEDKNSNQIKKTFTVYVVITDGEAPDTDQKQDEEVILTPKVLVQSYECTALTDKGELHTIKAGDKIKVCVTLVNTSKTQPLNNMTVTAAAASESLILSSISDCQYIETVGEGASFDVIYEYETKSDMPAGQYDISVSYDFAYGRGMSSSGSGTARVTVTQPLEMELSVVRLPDKAVVSDTVPVDVRAINLSRAKAYNVRAVIEADGFSPAGTVFIGDVDAGISADGSGQIAVTGLTKGSFPYGQTNGTVSFFYEDADGNEFTDVKKFSTVIESPFSENTGTEDKPDRWWGIMTVIAVIIAAFTVWGVVMKIRECRKNEQTS